MKIDILGVRFDSLTKEDAVETALGMLENGDKGYIVTPNPEIVWLCRSDERLKDIVNSATLVLPDGIGIIYGAKILGRPLKSRIPGIDFIQGVFDRLKGTGKKVFLFGAKPGVADAAAENLMDKYPGLKVVDTCDGYFDDDSVPIDKINKAKPDLLMVCLGCPKQEKWMADNIGRLDVKLMVGLGGSLDVFAGTVQRAPEKWQKMGLEWLYRLIKEPRRIKRMIKLPAFVFAVIWQRIRGR